MTQVALTFDEFAAEHGGDSVFVPSIGRGVFPDGASWEQTANGPWMFPPPLDTHRQLEWQYLRSVEVVERAHQEFTEAKQQAMALGAGGLIPKLHELRDQHAEHWKAMHELHRQLLATPEEVRKAHQATFRREAEEREMHRQSAARSEIQQIRLVSEESPEPVEGS